MYHSTQRNDSPDLPDIVPNEFQEITPLVQTPAVSSRSQKSILVLGSSLIGLFIACSAVWYCFKDSRESDTDDTFTGLAELETCGRKLMWAAHPGMCAAAKGAYHGAEVALQPCGTLGLLDEWIFTETGEAKRARLASSPHFCLDVLSQGKAFPGAKLHLSECSESNAPNQHFNITKNGYVRSHDMCMDVQYGSSSPGTTLQLWHCTGPQQLFELLPCQKSCFKQIQFRKTGQCLTTAGWHLKAGLALMLAACMDTNAGSSQFEFSDDGGQLHLALNRELCVEVKASHLHLAKCAKGNLQQDFVLDGALMLRSQSPKPPRSPMACIMAQANQLQISPCDKTLAEVQAFSSGCQSVLRPESAAESLASSKGGCPRQLKWSSHPELCIGTMQWQVGHGEDIVLALCENHGIDRPRQHWISTPGGKIVLASSPSYCLDVKENYAWGSDGAHLQLSPCIEGAEGQHFTFDWDHKIRQGDRCVNVVEQIALPFSKLELVYCGENQQFVPDVCEHDEHAIPTNRKGSFLVVGDWGWDALVHGNVPKAACQQEIGTLMTQKMDELGDVKFIINVGDSFYPDGLTSKQDPRWDKQWRDRYPEKLRSVPWYSVYGNHDTHHDPGMCHPESGSQINGNLQDLWTFYMPSYNWHIEHPDLNLEVVALDLNKFMEGWNHSRPVDELELTDCQYSQCPQQCVDNAELRADGAFDLMTNRLNSSTRSNLIVFSHYPTDYFTSVPEFLDQLRPRKPGRTVAYFSGHRHNTDQTSTFKTGPHDWLVGGGGGWSCDGLEQGFVVATIDENFQLKTHPVLMNPYTCCPDLVNSGYVYRKK